MDANELYSKLKEEFKGSILERQRFGRSNESAIWVESRAIAKVAGFISGRADWKLDWVENLSAAQLDQDLVITYFLRSTEGVLTALLRTSLALKNADDEVDLHSVVDAWPSAAPFELEIRELFGVRFLNESNEPVYLSKPRLVEGIIGFPLRKKFSFPSVVQGIVHSRPAISSVQDPPIGGPNA